MASIDFCARSCDRGSGRFGPERPPEGSELCGDRYFLQIEGINDESTEHLHEDRVEVDSMRSGVSNRGSGRRGRLLPEARACLIKPHDIMMPEDEAAIETIRIGFRSIDADYAARAKKTGDAKGKVSGECKIAVSER